MSRGYLDFANIRPSIFRNLKHIIAVDICLIGKHSDEMDPMQYYKTAIEFREHLENNGGAWIYCHQQFSYSQFKCV